MLSCRAERMGRWSLALDRWWCISAGLAIAVTGSVLLYFLWRCARGAHAASELTTGPNLLQHALNAICNVQINHEDVLVTAGLDGRVCVTELYGCSTAPIRSWPATSSNTTPCHVATACGQRGVIFSASQSENSGSFWELSTGRRLKQLIPLGGETRNEYCTIMKAAFDSEGTLVYSNSNDYEGALLKVIQPMV